MLNPSYSYDQMINNNNNNNKAVLNHGKLTKSQNISLTNHRATRNMQLDKTCKYHCVEEDEGIDNS